MKLVDINVIGNLTREDNIISGFSTSNYGTLYAPFSPGGQDFEIVIKFKSGNSNNNNNNTIFNSQIGLSSNERYGIILLYNSGNILSCNFPNADGSTYFGDIRITTIQNNTTYWMKIKRLGNSLYGYYSTDGINYIEGETHRDNAPVFPDLSVSLLGVRNNGSFYEYLNGGEIDLSECYIDIAGERFWSGCRNLNTNYYTYNSTFKDITLTGSPIISNGEISGFSTSKYATTTVNIPITGINTFEVGCKFTTGTTYNSYMQILSSPKSGTHRTGFDIQLDNSPRKVMLIFYDNDTYFGFSANDNIADNTTYWCKWIYNGTNLKSYYSYDGVNYILNNTNTDLINDLRNAISQFITGTTTIGINPEHTSAYVFTGSIDLKQTYIKINNKTIWTGTYPQVDTVSTYYNYSKENSK